MKRIAIVALGLVPLLLGGPALAAAPPPPAAGWPSFPAVCDGQNVTVYLDPGSASQASFQDGAVFVGVYYEYYRNGSLVGASVNTIGRGIDLSTCIAPIPGTSLTVVVHGFYPS
jgi:hypothetical protein